MSEVIFCRNRYAEAFLQIIGGLILIAFAIFEGSWLIGILGFFMLISVKNSFKVGTITKELKKDIVLGKITDLSNAPPEIITKVINKVDYSFPVSLKAKEKANLANDVWERINTKAPGIFASISMLILYSILPFIIFIGFSVGEFYWGYLTGVYDEQLYQGKYSDAEKVAISALEVAEKTFEPDHPIVAESLNNLALAYDSQGKYAEAESLYRQSLEIYEKVQATDTHFNTYLAITLDNLGGMYREQGKYAEAEPLYKRALEIYEKALGPNHPNVATALENMAELYRKIGKKDEAKKLEERAEKIRSKNR